MLFSLSFSIFAQSRKIDSLRVDIQKAKQDTVKARLYNELGKVIQKNNPDSAIFFFNKAYLHSQSSSAHARLQRANSLASLGWVYCCYKSIYDTSVIYCNKGLDLFLSLSSEKDPAIIKCANMGIISCYNALGYVHKNKGNFPLSLEYYQKSLVIAEAMNDKMKISGCYNNIGNIHDLQGSFDKAIADYLKALKISEEIGDKKVISICYNNIGGVYNEQGRNDKALENFVKALKIFEEISDKKGMSACYINIGNAYKDLGNYDKAIDVNLKSLKIKEELGDKNGIAIVWNNIAELNIRIAESKLINQIEKNKHYNEAIFYGLKAYNLAKEINGLPLIKNASLQLKIAFKAIGNTAKSLEYAETYIAYNDSMFKVEKTNAIAEMESKYQNEKKQKEIELLEKNKAIQSEEITKQRLLRNSFVIGFILVCVLAVVVLRSYRQKRKANTLLRVKNNQIQLQNDEIEKANLVISEKNKVIVESIEYAKTIQEAILTSDDVLCEMFKEHFILFLPKDIVSGDFYWAYKSKSNKVFWAAADCTGHGVSGAFMTMIGNSLLNEIIIENGIEEPNQILDNLCELVIKTLNKDHDLDHIVKMRNGMDISLCVWDIEKKQLLFSGANNPVLIIRKGEMTELKGDKQPIGLHKKKEPFTLKTFDLQPGDKIYTFSDGYSDQLGGVDFRRFKSVQLKQKLLDIYNLPMNVQKEELFSTFDFWKGTRDQTDDIVLMGVTVE